MFELNRPLRVVLPMINARKRLARLSRRTVMACRGGERGTVERIQERAERGGAVSSPLVRDAFDVAHW